MRTVYLELDNKHAEQIELSESDIIVKINKWVPIKKYISINTNQHYHELKHNVHEIWPCTIHKMQDLSVTSTVVKFDLENQKSVNESKMYVALSTVTSIANLFLIGMSSKLMKILLLNIADSEKTGLIIFIQIRLIVIFLLYIYSHFGIRSP